MQPLRHRSSREIITSYTDTRARNKFASYYYPGLTKLSHYNALYYNATVDNMDECKCVCTHACTGTLPSKRPIPH